MPATRKLKPEKVLPQALIIKGSFKGKLAVVLQDYDVFAKLYLPGMIVFLSETFYVKKSITTSSSL